MHIAVQEHELDPWAAVAAYQTRQLEPGSYGATAVFVGTMRDFSAGEQVSAMDLEHYPGMTEKSLTAIASEAAQRWDIVNALVVHRYGRVNPGDPIVVISVWSVHRGAATDACRFIIEQLKSIAPFWKKEHTGSGGRWVEGNTTGY